MFQKWWVLAAVACGTFMATLDSSIVNIALPTLTKELATDLYRIKWVVIVYLLVLTCLLLPCGRLSDQYGRKRIFQLGLSIFTLGSLSASVSSDLGWLIAARVVQAIGSAMLMANGPAIITATFPASERGAALGTMAMVVSAGLISGPSLGGLLISTLGWPSIFWVNLPVGLAGMLLVHHYVAKDHMPRQRVPFDWAGAVLQTIFLLSFILAFDHPSPGPDGAVRAFPISRWIMGVIAVGVGAVFIKVESDAEAPLLDLTLLRNRTFWTANLASFLTFVAYSSVFVLMPFFLEDVMRMATRSAGLFMSAVPLTILIVAPISGRLSDRLGSAGLSIAGALVGAAALLGMSGAFGTGIHEGMGQAGIVLALVGIGLATGLFQSPNNSAIMGAVPQAKLGVASAMLATVRNLGLVTGTGLSMGLFTWRMETSGNDFVSSLHYTHFVAGIISLGAMVASLRRVGSAP
jgi:EmrB/QacA subfamily drug resistance transporter